MSKIEFAKNFQKHLKVSYSVTPKVGNAINVKEPFDLIIHLKNTVDEENQPLICFKNIKLCVKPTGFTSLANGQNIYCYEVPQSLENGQRTSVTVNMMAKAAYPEGPFSMPPERIANIETDAKVEIVPSFLVSKETSAQYNIRPE